VSREADYISRPQFLDDLPAIPFWKRAIDVTVSGTGLLLLSPLVLIVAIAIIVDSRGGVFFRQTRVGKGGRPFTCWKFRSMHRGADLVLPQLAAQNEAKGFIFKMRNDPRRTRVGRFVRKTSIDEVPQLLNVLRGEMSLVGPRPPLLSEVVQYDEHQLRRLVVAPGITGLWQVTKRGSHDFEDMVELDVEYARRLSLGLDLWILMRTVPTVLFAKGSY
jgi:lipopolysaccharide/colanic/teichoic acid biosynthesis glycosyltransferase